LRSLEATDSGKEEVKKHRELIEVTDDLYWSMPEAHNLQKPVF
jgi:DNA-binding PadR family transcriptional regulator